MTGDDDGSAGGSGSSGSDTGVESGGSFSGGLRGDSASTDPSSARGGIEGSNPFATRREEDEESPGQPSEQHAEYDPAAEGEYQAVPSPHSPPGLTNDPFAAGGMPPSLPVGSLFDSDVKPLSNPADSKSEEVSEPTFDSAPEEAAGATGAVVSEVSLPLGFTDAAIQSPDFAASAGTTVIPSAAEPKSAATLTGVSPAPPPRSSFPVLLFTWASLATLIAIYLYVTRPPQPGYLENLHYDELERKQFKMPTDELSVRQIIPMGETKRLGNVEITPLAVETTTVRVLAADEVQSGDEVDEPTEPIGRTDEAVALTLRIKNVSTDQRFRPTDPVYTFGKRVNGSMKRLRQFQAAGLFVKTYSYAHARNNLDEVLLPLDVDWAAGEIVEGQEYPMLGPGEAAEVRFLVQAPKEIDAPMLFRAMICKGVASNGFPVAAVVGVPFGP